MDEKQLTPLSPLLAWGKLIHQMDGNIVGLSEPVKMIDSLKNEGI